MSLFFRETTDHGDELDVKVHQENSEILDQMDQKVQMDQEDEVAKTVSQVHLVHQDLQVHQDCQVALELVVSTFFHHSMEIQKRDQLTKDTGNVQ